MGSIARVTLHYLDLAAYLKSAELPIYAAVMDGLPVYTETLATEAILVMGNEANGISAEISAIIQRQITIPNFRKDKKAESLNVATATAVLLSEFRRSIEK